MNGDIGKLPPGAGYPTTPESLGTVGGAVHDNITTGLDYTVMNGGQSGELMLDSGASGFDQVQQHTISMGGAAGYGNVDVNSIGETSLGEVSMPGIPIDQLKQMLSSQLEYYFSR